MTIDSVLLVIRYKIFYEENASQYQIQNLPFCTTQFCILYVLIELHMTWYKCKLESVLPTEDEFQVTYEWIAGTKN